MAQRQTGDEGHKDAPRMDQMRSGKVMGEEDTEVLLNQGARKAAGERRERGQSKGERRIDVRGLRESTAGSQRCFKG